MAAFAAAMSLELLKSTWESTQQAVKGHLDIDVKEDTAARIEALATRYAHFADGLKKAREAMSSPEAAAQRDIKALQDKLGLLEKILKAEEQEALANLATKKDQMSPQAYAAAEENIKAAFAGKETQATSKEKQDEIDRKRLEAAELEKKSAEEKAKAEAIASHAGTYATIEERAEKAKEALKKDQEDLARVNRLRAAANGDDVQEYLGLDGQMQKVKDIAQFYREWGMAKGSDVQKIIEQRITLDEAAISSGPNAKRKLESGPEATGQAVKDKADAEKLNADANTEQSNLNAANQTGRVTSALGEASTALGREHAAEGNNTPQGYADAQAAHQAAAKAVTDLRGALKGVTDTHSEAYAAIMKALSDLQAEDRKLSARLAQTQFNGK